MTRRTATIEHETTETCVRIELDLDGSRRIDVASGIGFLDHMLRSMAFHAGWDLRLECRGDLEVDDHHTTEDCALALGKALSRALGDRAGIARFGWAHAPLDESLARSVIDLSGRPWPQIELGLTRDIIGSMASENLTHFLVSLAMTSGAALHVDVIRGSNDHHRAEAAFKATALALRQATARTEGSRIPSTKGRL